MALTYQGVPISPTCFLSSQQLVRAGVMEGKEGGHSLMPCRAHRPSMQRWKAAAVAWVFCSSMLTMWMCRDGLTPALAPLRRPPRTLDARIARLAQCKLDAPPSPVPSEGIFGTEWGWREGTALGVEVGGGCGNWGFPQARLSREIRLQSPRD